MAGYGTGVPIWFMCPKLRRIWPRSSYQYGKHTVERTGRTRPRPAHGNLHPRMMTTSYEYRCTCGHVGWTAHKDILHAPVTPTTEDAPNQTTQGDSST